MSVILGKTAMSLSLNEKLTHILNRLQPAGTVWVGFSGGLDSTVLLSSLANLRKDFSSLSLHAIHINHGLHVHADLWQQHCVSFCEDLNIDVCIQKIDVKSVIKNQSVEAVARDMRYQVFSELLNENDYLFTAHHLDDHTETIFLQLLRGTGLKGLSGIPFQKKLAKGSLIRPFLDVSRQDLLNYATENNLNWVEDGSNDSLQFDRNFLRKEIVPKLKQRWPALNASMRRMSQHVAEAQQLLQNIAAEDFLKVSEIPSRQLSIQKLIQFNLIRQKNILRYWFEILGYKAPPTLKLNEVLKYVNHLRKDAKVIVHWPGVEIRIFNDYLYALDIRVPHDPSLEIEWDLSSDLLLPNNLGVLKAESIKSIISLPAQQKLMIKFRQGGERFHPHNRIGSHPLKKLFQEWKVPPWERDRIPLIYLENELMIIPNYGINKKLFCDNVKNLTVTHLIINKN
jgi:tRNA(Ile)-lysidine synthase